MRSHHTQPGSPCGLRIPYLIGLVGVLLDPFIGLAIAIPHFFLFRRFLSRLDTPLRRRRGVVFVLGGIEGPSFAQIRMVNGLHRGGWRGAIRIVEWNRGLPFVRPLVNLSSRVRHERGSDELVVAIENHRSAHPATAICLIAQSGGCWIAVRALEKLAADRRCVDAVALIAPAISPGYDLSSAAGGCATPLLSVHSPFDWVMLGLGTTLLGTADRRWGPAAGLLGWRTPLRGGTGVPDRMNLIKWEPACVPLGHLGGHCTSAAPAFVAARIAPLLVAAASLAIECARHIRLFDRIEDDRARREPDLVVDA